MWEAEEIPDTAQLFYRIHEKDIRDGKPVPGAFRERGKGEKKSMSTDWDKYSTPELSRSRARVPEQNAIVEFSVAGIRGIGLSVSHSPDYDSDNPDDPNLTNRAHSDVKGIDNDKTTYRKKLRSMYEWRIKVED